MHPKSDVQDCIYLKKYEGRGFIAIEDCVKLAVRGLEMCVRGSEKGLLQGASGGRVDGVEAASVLKKEKK